jgi:hypothetical protein
MASPSASSNAAGGAQGGGTLAMLASAGTRLPQVPSEACAAIAPGLAALRALVSETSGRFGATLSALAQARVSVDESQTATALARAVAKDRAAEAEKAVKDAKVYVLCGCVLFHVKNILTRQFFFFGLVFGGGFFHSQIFFKIYINTGIAQRRSASVSTPRGSTRRWAPPTRRRHTPSIRSATPRGFCGASRAVCSSLSTMTVTMMTKATRTMRMRRSRTSLAPMPTPRLSVWHLGCCRAFFVFCFLFFV